ncbi:hypothetical protein COW36_19395 [bacterium (Candidatus Blackallbacteria) CG17_big_fil_post_rev_8_21_14_2_50_48_46]|uniref:Uncharacterized protein n=1 Tax=bacterium (Candidatus Blackallbacteria) CG17_big_fil_post_rev_8_21_14_2_50_48_46 TaxID=2014261 RepID=A0A2M7G1C4_9BACT|nr:MAG: hypothetical protein COW64_25075 [bacterium (Candidatus Blackallbacteria) CG18_big_fil_WC_8_21_14_2_50_49_26]PIW15088.1 MAG: hypothetical protein COW36_19395 [bacterium (Candidatus Blackallbacteria) CG17_big_fil_post_rev_8_21_14_2_50_48_46]PIW47589.1 MAG: hypothetical protein COW20_11925 [bacterium (Candidatus Blackallbacteria) CG13_big_fil_rev_8_21_14_2_50_49_14]
MSLELDQRLHFYEPQLREGLNAQTLAKLHQSSLENQPHVIFENHENPIPLEEVMVDPHRYQASSQALLSVPLQNGKALVIPLENLQKEHLLESLEKAHPLNPRQQHILIDAAAPLLDQIRHSSQPSEGLAKFAPGAPADAKLNPVDQKSHDLLRQIGKTINEEVKNGLLPAENKKSELLKRFLLQSAPAFAHYSKNKQAALLKLLADIPLKELIAADIQGFGGGAVGGGVIGEGKEGHYVNSLLSSVVQLINTNRLSYGVYKAIKDLKKAPLHADLQPQRMGLLRSSLQDIAFPHQINQHARGTCAATSAQILLALQDPGKYLNIVKALASPDGKVDDGSIEREPGTLTDDLSGRSISGRLIQPAFMEYANKELNYDNATDKHSDAHSGLYSSETTRLIQYLFPLRDYQNYSIFEGEPKPTQAEVYAKVKAHIDAGTPLSVGLRWDDGGHRVIVSKIDAAAKTVYLLNPWGELQSMPLDEFKDRLRSACLPKESNQLKPALEFLPGAMAKTEAYPEIASYRYRTPLEQMQRDPKLKTSFSAAQQTEIGDAFKDLKLGTYALEYLRNTCNKHPLSAAQATEITQQLKRCSSAYEAFQLLRLIENGYDAVKKGSITQTTLSQILNVRPGAFLNAAENKALLEALIAGDKVKIQLKLENSALELAQVYVKHGYETLSADKQEAFRTAALKDAMRSNPLISEEIKTLLLSLNPEKLEKAEMLKLLQALALGQQDKIETQIQNLISKDKATWSVEQAAEKLESLAKAGCWQAFDALFIDLAVKWTWDSDNLAESLAIRLKAIIDKVPKDTLKALYKTMDDMYQDGTTVIAKNILMGAKNW